VVVVGVVVVVVDVDVLVLVDVEVDVDVLVLVDVEVDVLVLLDVVDVVGVVVDVDVLPRQWSSLTPPLLPWSSQSLPLSGCGSGLHGPALPLVSPLPWSHGSCPGGV
jgi:hypothetical protein